MGCTPAMKAAQATMPASDAAAAARGPAAHEATHGATAIGERGSGGGGDARLDDAEKAAAAVSAAP